MVAVISCAAAAIWLVLLDCVLALPAAWIERALISVVAAESVAAPWVTETSTLRIRGYAAVECLSQLANLIATGDADVDCHVLGGHGLHGFFSLSSRGAISRVSIVPMKSAEENDQQRGPGTDECCVAAGIGWRRERPLFPSFAWILKSRVCCSRASANAFIAASDEEGPAHLLPCRHFNNRCRDRCRPGRV